MSSKVQYRLPAHLRELLKSPIGHLISGEDLKKQIKYFDLIITVGDHVSASLLDLQVFPNLMIIDFHTKRKAISSSQQQILTQAPGYEQLMITNPAGVLTKDLMDTLKTHCSSLSENHRMQVIIKGEEDLAALPAILYAPSNATIIYGMPYKGVVIVPATEEFKEKVRSILSEM